MKERMMKERMMKERMMKERMMKERMMKERMKHLPMHDAMQRLRQACIRPVAGTLEPES